MKAKLKKGDKVAVHNMAISGKRFLEGLATLKRFLDRKDYASVCGLKGHYEFWRVNMPDGYGDFNCDRWVRVEDKVL